MGTGKKIIIEVMYKANHCLPCVYMDKAVEDILPEYSDIVDYLRVDLMTPSGKKRFLELSVSLFGEDGVYKHKRIAPLPSLFINGELFFETVNGIRGKVEVHIQKYEDTYRCFLEDNPIKLVAGYKTIQIREEL